MNGRLGNEPKYSKLIKYHTLKGRDAKFLEPARKDGGRWEIS